MSACSAIFFDWVEIRINHSELFCLLFSVSKKLPALRVQMDLILKLKTWGRDKNAIFGGSEHLQQEQQQQQLNVVSSTSCSALVNNVDTTSVCSTSRSFNGSISESISRSLNGSVKGSMFNLDQIINVPSKLPLELQGIDFNCVLGRKVSEFFHYSKAST